VLDRSLICEQFGVIARGRLRLLRRAVDCFGFHLAGSTSGRIRPCMSARSPS
jgi:phosphoenolpyruvate carboxylase